MGMKIRKADKNDAANIAALGICVWIDTYATEGVFDKISRYVFSELIEEKILELISNKNVLVIVEENRLLGYIVLGAEKENKVEIETLYVLPKFHGQGIGRQLIKEALNIFQKSLWLSVWELNNKAIGFYQKLGFKETRELYFDLYGDKIRNIVLELTI
jgi:ribosomal protein S18 acetylase RimI-like enzyme